jgi:hypothetical protein
MMKRFLLCFFILLILENLDAYVLSCSNKLVELGERKAELRMKCGAPTLVEEWQERILAYRDFAGEVMKGKQAEYDTEEWTYNFGLNRFLFFGIYQRQVVEYRSRVLRIHRSALRGDETHLWKNDRRGERKINVLMKCGPPTFKKMKKIFSTNNNLG